MKDKHVSPLNVMWLHRHDASRGQGFGRNDELTGT